MVGPDPVDVASLKADAARFVDLSAPRFPEVSSNPQRRQAVIDEIVARDLARERWKSRNRVQRPSVILFWPSLALAVLLRSLRRDKG